MAVALPYFVRTTYLFAFIFLAACGTKKSSIAIDESYTLSPDSYEAFGASAAQSITQKAFPQQPWIANKRSFDQWEKTWRKSDNPQVYLLFTPSLQALEDEADAMQRFVANGNTLLIATDEINETVEEFFAFKILKTPDLLLNNNTGPMRDTWLQLHDSSRLPQQKFGYFHYPLSYFLSASSKYQSVQVLSHNSSNQPSALRIRMGMGQVIVATNARSMGNYFLLSKQNVQYLLGLYAYLPANPTAIVWDRFYYRNMNRPPADKPLFSALMANPALRWAMGILLVLALLWVVGNLRRKQKMIPVLAPNTNTTVSFVKTIAQLYFSKADHANIARKMTAHFLDHLRTNYYLPTSISGSEWPTLLHSKTGMPMANAQAMHQLMQSAQAGDPEFSSAQLLQLHFFIREAEAQKKAPVKNRRLRLSAKH